MMHPLIFINTPTRYSHRHRLSTHILSLSLLMTYTYTTSYADQQRINNTPSHTAHQVTLVLVSPAFSIKKSLLNTTAATMDSLQVLEAVRDGVASTVPTPTAIQSRGSRIANVFKSLLSQFRSLYRYPLKLVLRRLVHSDSFWRDGLSAAWAPSSKGGVQMVGPSVAKKLDTTDIFRYKLASMAAHLLRFVTAQKGSKSGSFPSPEVVPGVDQSSLLAGTHIRSIHIRSIHI